MIYVVAELRTGAFRAYNSIHVVEYSGTTSVKRQNTLKFGALKIKIEIEIEIASFRQDCRKDQDCFFSGNPIRELIGTVFGGNPHLSPVLLSPQNMFLALWLPQTYTWKHHLYIFVGRYPVFRKSALTSVSHLIRKRTSLQWSFRVLSP